MVFHTIHMTFTLPFIPPLSFLLNLIWCLLPLRLSFLLLSLSVPPSHQHLLGSLSFEKVTTSLSIMSKDQHSSTLQQFGGFCSYQRAAFSLFFFLNRSVQPERSFFFIKPHVHCQESGGFSLEHQLMVQFTPTGIF